MLIAIGLLGEYVARIYEEIKGRPLYVVTDTVNLNHTEEEISRAVVLGIRAPVSTMEPVHSDAVASGHSDAR